MHVDSSIAFTRSCQCAPTYITCFLGPSPNPERHLNRLSHFCTDHDKELLYITTGRSFPLLLLLPMRDLNPRNTWFIGPTRNLNRNGISFGSAVFAQFAAEFPYTLQWAAPSPLKIAPLHGYLDPRLIYGSFGQPESSTQTASRSVVSFLQGSLLWQTDQQTSATRSVLGNNGRIYVRSTAMRPNNNTRVSRHWRWRADVKRDQRPFLSQLVDQERTMPVDMTFSS